MNVKELANRYRKEIPEGLDEESFLKALYIKIGRDRVFDEKYYFGNFETQRKIYRLSERERTNTKLNIEKRTIICCSLSYNIEHLLREFGFRCIVTTSSSIGEHVFPIVLLSDGRHIKFDVQRDLEFIQTNCKTRFFGTTERDDDIYGLSTIDDERQIQLDKNIGYISDISDYKDDAIERLASVLQNNSNLPIWQRLSIVLKDPRINDLPNYMGYVEAFKYYHNCILPKYFSKKDLEHSIHLITCSRSNSAGEEEYTNCIFVGVPNAPNEVYLFSRVHNRYVATPFDSLIKLQQDGLKIGIKKPLNGSKKLLKALDNYSRYGKENSNSEHSSVNPR